METVWSNWNLKHELKLYKLFNNRHQTWKLNGNINKCNKFHSYTKLRATNTTRLQNGWIEDKQILKFIISLFPTSVTHLSDQCLEHWAKTERNHQASIWISNRWMHFYKTDFWPTYTIHTPQTTCIYPFVL